MQDDNVPFGNPLCAHKHGAETYCTFMYESDGISRIRCDGYNARCAGYLPKEKEQVFNKPINHVLAARLVAALKIYYPAADENLDRLAENAFSGCRGSQRENRHELRDFLKGFKDD